MIDTQTTTPTREEWLAERRLGIGASDAPAILGESKWGSPYSVWAEKTGRIEPPDLGEREDIQAGNIFEAPILNWFNRRTDSNAVLWPPHQSIAHADYPWMRCTPDARVGNDVNVQIKNVNAFRAGEWVDLPPMAYRIQVQHEMAVLNSKRTILVVCFGGNRLHWYDVERNDRFIDKALIPILREFWDLVQTNTRPQIDGSEATLETIKRLHPDDDGSIIDHSIDEELGDWVYKLEDAKKSIKDFEAIRDEANANVRAAIGDATFAQFAHADYSLKTQARQQPLCPHCGERAGPASTHRVLRAGVKIPDDAVVVEPKPEPKE